MKLSGMAGTGSGKLGSMVYATVAGEQIVRQYQPVVSNPSTQAQVDQRAKLKLASQIARAMANVSVIRRDGLKSSRNLFIKKNFENISINADKEAEISLAKIQLTDGIDGAPTFTLVRDGGHVKFVNGDAPIAPGSYVMCILYTKDTEGKLNLLMSQALESPFGGGETFIEVAVPANVAVVGYMYAYEDTNARANGKFANYNVNNAVQMAKLVATRAIKTTDVTFSGTSGATLAAE